MLQIDWDKKTGWGKPQITPYGPMRVPISATSLHYGISCYEGLNVIQNKNTNEAQSFRSDEHLLGFLDSSNHLDMPLFDTEELYNCLRHLIDLEKGWFPDTHEDKISQLYVRLCHISMDPVMGVKSPDKTKVYAIVSPTRLSQKRLSVKCSDGVNKNWPLGHGQYTLGGNLGPLVPFVSDAKQNGFDDVLWMLDDFVQEMTVLNTFFVKTTRYGQLELLTPPDNGCILPGTIRNTLLDLAP